MDRTSGEPLDYGATLAAHAVFRQEGSGEKIAAKVEASSEKGNPATSFFYFAPAGLLESDTWYALEITTSADVHVLDGDGKAVSGRWSRPFFTGSAPHVSRVEFIAKSSQVRVEFSEPVETKNLVASQILDSAMVKCFYFAGDCVAAAPPDAPILRELVFQLSGPPGKSPQLNMLLPSSMKGSPRTIAEGKQVAGTPWAEMASNNMKFSTSSAGKWGSCQQGAAECWSYER